MTDPISDMLTRIRNAVLVKKDKVSIPFSKLKSEIAHVMLGNNLISSIGKKGRRVKKFLELGLIYDEKGPRIHGVKRVSRSGQRIYAGYKTIKKVKSGYGLSIVSTPKGLMTDKDARKNKLGGEIICEVW